MKSLIVCLIAIVAITKADNSASNLIHDIYKDCISQYSISCIKPRSLAWLSKVARDDEIKITDHLAIVKRAEYEGVDPRGNSDPMFDIIEAVEDFVDTHALRVKVPGEISDAADYVPRSLVDGLPSELNMPLVDDGEEFEGRFKKKKIIKKLKIKSKHGFMKKVIIPFLLGLKFKASVLVPLALAMIALKTWKALTLGLISLVLSGAMVIFKFTKPKVVNYEVIHYPQQHVDHHLEHASSGWDSHGHGPYQARSDLEANEMAYSAQI